MSAREISPISLSTLVDYGPKRASSPPPIGVSHLCPTSDAVYQQSKQLQSFSPIGSPITDDVYQSHFRSTKSAPRGGSYGMIKSYDLFCSDSLEMMQFINTMADKPESLLSTDAHEEYVVDKSWHSKDHPSNDRRSDFFSPLVSEQFSVYNPTVKYSSSAPTTSKQNDNSFSSKSIGQSSLISPSPIRTLTSNSAGRRLQTTEEWSSLSRNGSLYKSPTTIEQDYDSNLNETDSDLPSSEPAWMEEWISGMGGMELEESNNSSAKLNDVFRGSTNFHQAIMHKQGWDSNIGGSPSNNIMMMGKGTFVQPNSVQHNVPFKPFNQTSPYPFTTLPAGLHAAIPTRSNPDHRGRSNSPSIYESSSRSSSPLHKNKRSQSPPSPSPSPSPSTSPPRSPYVAKHHHQSTTKTPELSDTNISSNYSYNWNTHQRHPSRTKKFNNYTKDSMLLMSQSAPNIAMNPTYDYPSTPNIQPTHQRQHSGNTPTHQRQHSEDMKYRSNGSHIHLNTPASSPSSSPNLSPLSSPSPIRNNSTNVISPSSPSSSPSHHHSQYRYRHKSKANRHRRRSTRKEDDLMRFEIYLEKANNGEDVRTTLMIKNIPNKYDQEMLLETLNKKFKGTYDFFYLPIDFKNKCNVGYAFINFISYLTVAKFYEEFNQQKWEKFNSEKVCKITYARIQGKISFIDHFRNSSLMYEDPSCRPLIFHSCGPNVGTLEIFPPANISPARARVNNANISPNLTED